MPHFCLASWALRGLRRCGLGLAAALLLTGCEGETVTSPDWIALPPSLADGSTLRLVAVDSGLCLTATGRSDRDRFELAECADEPRQAFRLSYKNAGSFQLVSSASNKCLDVDSASDKPLANLVLWGCGDGYNQQLLLKNAGNLLQFQMRHSGLCVDVEGGSRAPGARITQWPCTGARNQQFWAESLNPPSAPPKSKRRKHKR
jgi:Ricin-type beta-trefoil lectin domain-like